MSSSSLAPSSASKPANRRRSSSVTNALKQIPLNHGESPSKTPRVAEESPTLSSSSEVKPLAGRPGRRPKPKSSADDLPEIYRSKGFVDDLKTGRWMLVPSSAFLLLCVPVVLYFNHALLIRMGILKPGTANPFASFVTLPGRLPNGKYGKAFGDLLFLANAVVFWSFVRQFVTIHLLRPLAMSLGIKGGKIMRFVEQGYAVFYFGILGPIGIYVMRGLPTWWYETKYFWIDYPHKELTFELKAYYLMQAGYWLQQTIILAGKIEKPRKDFKELVVHHLVTLWLIGWSYNTYCTYIGVSVFVTMDVSDIFLALAKCVNYVNETASVPIFAFFVCVWTYFRHYLNIWILWSVVYEWHLIPVEQRQGFVPWKDEWMAPWIQWQIFGPIFLLQLINLFWYFLILRILFRAIFSTEAVKDDRSDDEEEGEETTSQKVMSKGGKAE